MDLKNQIINALFFLFIRRVENTITDNKDPHFYKWVYTFAIAKYVAAPISEVRKILKELESEGEVVANRTYRNNTSWALMKTPGFEPRKYSDYLKPVSDVQNNT